MLLAALLASLQDASSLRLPSLVGDHMVLQRDAEVRVWGWAAPGAAIQVEVGWSEQPSSARSGPDGGWEVRLRTPADAPGPHRITISDGAETRVLEDVLLGEVWVCGGQSNMEWPLAARVIGGAEAAAAADWPEVRWFDVPHAVAMAPAADCGGAWSVVTPQLAPRMSAIGFFFAEALRRDLPGVPLGLIGCNWGGTVAEAWTSEELLTERGDFELELARMRAARARGEDQAASVAALQDAWWRNLDAGEQGLREGWQRTDHDDAAWETAVLPGVWAGDLAAHDGVVWYRKTVAIPAEWAQQELVLELGPVDDCDDSWAGGEPCGSTRDDGAWNRPRAYVVPGARALGGTLTLALRVVDTGGGGGLHGEPAALRLFPRGRPDAAIPLAGQWKLRRGAALADLGAFPRQAWFHQNSPTALFHGMLAPVTRHTIRGAIFYQGESNLSRWWQYRSLFPDMVRSWRRAWGQGDFPFYWVQIAPFGYGRGEDAARLREAQALAVAAIPHGGMAVTMDVGDPRDIHPLAKREVGERLARLALAGAYGRAGVDARGPEFRSAEARGAEMILHFDHAEGLRTLDGAPPANFALAGADRVFHPAEARIEGATVVLRCAAVPAPVAARYCWGEADAGSLADAAGLPASSFRTDDWPERD